MPAEPVYDLERWGDGWRISDPYGQTVARYAAGEIAQAVAELNRLNAASEPEPSARH